MFSSLFTLSSDGKIAFALLLSISSKVQLTGNCSQYIRVYARFTVSCVRYELHCIGWWCGCHSDVGFLVTLTRWAIRPALIVDFYLMHSVSILSEFCDSTSYTPDTFFGAPSNSFKIMSLLVNVNSHTNTFKTLSCAEWGPEVGTLVIDWSVGKAVCWCFVNGLSSVRVLLVTQMVKYLSDWCELNHCVLQLWFWNM